jgi:hypothetical protein
MTQLAPLVKKTLQTTPEDSILRDPTQVSTLQIQQVAGGGAERIRDMAEKATFREADYSRLGSALRANAPLEANPSALGTSAQRLGGSDAPGLASRSARRENPVDEETLFSSLERLNQL